jgi:HEAT repeat protein
MDLLCAAEEKPNPATVQEKLGTPQLVKYVEARSHEYTPGQLDTLIRQLGSSDFDEREDAQTALMRAGTSALSRLRNAVANQDPEIARRARQCMKRIEGDLPFVAAALSLLIRRGEAEALPILLHYLPFALEPEQEEEIWFGLDALVSRQTKRVSFVIGDRKSTNEVVRAAAGYLTARYGNSEQQEKVTKLLRDDSPIVRLRTAQGFLGAGKTVGIPVLIELLDQPAVCLAWQAEELLCWAAGDDWRRAKVGAGRLEERRGCQQAWQFWWMLHERTVNPWQVRQSFRRPALLLAHRNVDDIRSKIMLLGGDGSVRWQVTIPAQIGSFQLLPNDRMLLAELIPDGTVNFRPGQGAIGKRGAVERSFDGTVRWQSDAVTGTWACRRLPDGNTLLVEPWKESALVTPDGTVVYREKLQPARTALTAFPPFLLPSGRLCYQEKGGTLVELAAQGGEVLNKVDPPGNVGRVYRCDALPGGGYFLYAQGEIPLVELDAGGKTVKRWTAWENLNLTRAVRQPNGSTILCCWRVNDTYLVEMDRTGRVVWDMLGEEQLKIQAGFSLVRLGFTLPESEDADLAKSLTRRLAELHSPDAQRRRVALFGLAQMKEQTRQTVPVLLKLLRDPNAQVRADAMALLEKVARPEDIDLFLRVASDSRPEVRLAVLRVSYEFRSKPDLLVPVLLSGLKDENVLVRREAARMSGIYPPPPQMLPALLAALKDSDRAKSDQEMSVGEYAAGALTAQGEQLSEVLPDIFAALEHEDPRVRRQLFATLGQVSRKYDSIARKVAPPCIEILKDVKRKDDWKSAAAVIRYCGPAAKPAVPVLVEILEKHTVSGSPRDKWLRVSVLSALGEMKKDAAAAAPAVANVLLDKQASTDEQDSAVLVLVGLGPAAKDVAPLLEKALPDRDKATQRYIREVLKAIAQEK